MYTDRVSHIYHVCIIFGELAERMTPPECRVIIGCVSVKWV